MKTRASAESLAMLLALITLWWAASHAQWVSKVFLPTPEATWASLVEGLQQGDLFKFTLGTVWRTLEFIRPLPASAAMPLAISIFGLSPSMVLAVVAFGAMWPVLLATVHGFAHVHVRLTEVAQALGLSRLAFVTQIGLPNALPDILSGMRLSMTVALIVAVVPMGGQIGAIKK